MLHTVHIDGLRPCFVKRLNMVEPLLKLLKQKQRTVNNVRVFMGWTPQAAKKEELFFDFGGWFLGDRVKIDLGDFYFCFPLSQWQIFTRQLKQVYSSKMFHGTYQDIILDNKDINKLTQFMEQMGDNYNLLYAKHTSGCQKPFI